MSSSQVLLKTHRVGERCTLNLSRAQTSSSWCGVVVRKGALAQRSSSSLAHGSKFRGPLPKAIEQLNSVTLIFTPTSKSNAVYLAEKESRAEIKCISFNEIHVKSPYASPMDFSAFSFIKTSLTKMAFKNIERT
ncbi:hypothetical protein TNCV_36271 [Trichonephila clavipes]|nr:hypothetical protein TNCV_36271 [Trichonephila clavipes]